jgi:exopolyphosphatase/guanosine-5'-triphosphate,3'-diphosphate pyrophosphatase
LKIASIDIGTNTCNLLIADVKPNQKPVFLHREKKAITLINNRDYENNTVSGESVSNLVNVVNNYKSTIEDYVAEKTIVTATSGIRSANNRKMIVDEIKKKTGISINVIDGDREAELVFSGVRNAIELNKEPVLIIDIGGGSIEFLIANNEQIFWKNSFQIGVARMLNTHNFADPLKESDIEIIKDVLNKTLSGLFQKCRELDIKELIGSSGSYETFANLIKYEFKDDSLSEDQPANYIDSTKFCQIHKKLVSFNFEERKNMPGMEIIRVKLIPIASVVTEHIISTLNIKIIKQSNYSIKEGLIFDYIRKNL